MASHGERGARAAFEVRRINRGVGRLDYFEQVKFRFETLRDINRVGEYLFRETGPIVWHKNSAIQVPLFLKASRASSPVPSIWPFGRPLPSRALHGTALYFGR
jgi:hypothetical protein